MFAGESAVGGEVFEVFWLAEERSVEGVPGVRERERGRGSGAGTSDGD